MSYKDLVSLSLNYAANNLVHTEIIVVSRMRASDTDLLVAKKSWNEK